MAKIGPVFSECRNDLNKGINVLFVGTPCHIHALKCFLNDEYNNLLCVDFVCHGTPDNSIWKEYIRELSGDRKIASVDFRDKTTGWKNYSVTVCFQDGSKYSKRHRDDLFFRAFMDNTILRKACYSCQFKGLSRESDLTLGDLWGAEELVPDMFDDKGASVVFIHSNNGREMFYNIKDQLEYKELLADDVIKHNKSVVEVTKKGVLYDKVNNHYSKCGSILKTLNRYYNPAKWHKALIIIYTQSSTYV